MSCNGCRVLRKGCSDDCMLRHCLQGIEQPQAQAHATVFVAKFFGRASLMSFVSSVPTNQRSALFQSLLYDAVGRTINPVNGAVGLLWTGNWHLCQLGVERVLRGGALNPEPEFFGGASVQKGFGSSINRSSQREKGSRSRMLKRKARCDVENLQAHNQCTVDTVKSSVAERVVVEGGRNYQAKKHRSATPSEESGTTTLGSRAVYCGAGAAGAHSGNERKLLTLFF